MENIAAAIYCRLSQDDGNAGESNSIQTQKALLKQYCAENRIPIAGVYCDDGWSGTNFERPQFKQMMEDIEAGKINVVIVKDLSRFVCPDGALYRTLLRGEGRPLHLHRRKL